jgi:hypothetical protein
VWYVFKTWLEVVWEDVSDNEEVREKMLNFVKKGGPMSKKTAVLALQIENLLKLKSSGMSPSRTVIVRQAIVQLLDNEHW